MAEKTQKKPQLASGGFYISRKMTLTILVLGGQTLEDLQSIDPTITIEEIQEAAEQLEKLGLEVPQ